MRGAVSIYPKKSRTQGTSDITDKKSRGLTNLGATKAWEVAAHMAKQAAVFMVEFVWG